MVLFQIFSLLLSFCFFNQNLIAMQQEFNPRDYVLSKRGDFLSKYAGKQTKVVCYSQIQSLTQSGETQRVVDIIDRLDAYDQQNGTDFLRQAFLEEGREGWTLLHLAAERNDAAVVSKIIHHAEMLGILETVLYSENFEGGSPHQVACAMSAVKKEYNYEQVIALLHQAMIVDLNLDCRSDPVGCPRAESCWKDPKSLDSSSDAGLDLGEDVGEWDDVVEYSRRCQVRSLIAVIIWPQDHGKIAVEEAKRDLLDDCYFN